MVDRRSATTYHLGRDRDDVSKVLFGGGAYPTPNIGAWRRAQVLSGEDLPFKDVSALLFFG